jgi:EF hand
MFNQLAALGLGLTTAVTALPAAAHEGCDPAGAGTAYPSYGPAVPTYLPAPRVQMPYPPVAQAGYRVVLARADYNYDGGITLAEAHAYGQAQFSREDFDRNGVLTRHELRRADDEFARGARSRDGVVTFAEYDANVQRQFYRLDLNRDGFLSRYELGTTGPARGSTVGWSWHWSL